MKLVKWDTAGEQVTEGNLGSREIVDAVRAVDWNTPDIVGVTLSRSSDNWADASGSLVDGGLSIGLEEDGVQYFAKEAPESLDTLIEFLCAYLQGDRHKVFEMLEGEPLTPDRLNELTAQASEEQRRLDGGAKVLLGLVLLAVIGAVLWFL